MGAFPDVRECRATSPCSRSGESSLPSKTRRARCRGQQAAQIAKGLKAQPRCSTTGHLYAEALQGRDVNLKSWQRECRR
jgi:hypothetical protein